MSNEKCILGPVILVVLHTLIKLQHLDTLTNKVCCPITGEALSPNAMKQIPKMGS